MISRLRMMTISCHDPGNYRQRMSLRAVAEAAARKGKDMDQTVYSQVLITCTTINVVIIISTLTMWIGTKIHDRREKKKKEQEDKSE